MQVHDNTLVRKQFWRCCHLLVFLESYWSITLVSSPREISHYQHLNLQLGVTNEGREAIKLISGAIAEDFKERLEPRPSNRLISGAVAGDSSLQDRGVAHYLLLLLFSLVSLPFSFSFCVPYQKWVPMKTPSYVTSLVTTTVTLSALLLLHLPLQYLLMKLNLLWLILL